MSQNALFVFCCTGLFVTELSGTQIPLYRALTGPRYGYQPSEVSDDCNGKPIPTSRAKFTDAVLVVNATLGEPGTVFPVV